MKKQKKILIIPILILIVILSSCCKTFAKDDSATIELSEEYEKYLELSDEEKEKVIEPLMYDIPKTSPKITSPLKVAKMLKATADTKYSLKDVIPDNIVVKNQQTTNACWTFASLGMLESTLALMNYKNGINPIVYDFSERHMEYATSDTFKDGTNKNGFHRKVDSGGNSNTFEAYLTNGTGAISEKEMPFENNIDLIELSKIQNVNVITQLNDAINFPTYKATENKTQIKQQMKQHINDYGGIYAQIYGASLYNNECYNNKTGALYCDDDTKYQINHSVLIVGWDDNYSKDNFIESKKPQNNGAWIIKNSWGTEQRYTLEEMKNYIFKQLADKCAEYGWTSADMIPDEIAKKVFEELGYTIENDEAVMNIGDNGFMYISYEDVNVYKNLYGITNAQQEVTYDKIYQYNQFGGPMTIIYKKANKGRLATVFDKKTNETEYLTQVSINTPETYTCKVYVNPNGSSKEKSDLQLVQLKSGETVTFGAGYHTIEFKNPVQITGNSFTVVIEVEGTQTDKLSIATEYNYSEFFGENANSASALHNFDNVTVANGKCFIALGENSEEWIDTSKEHERYENLPNYDTTIKAFTTVKPSTPELENIEITTPPSKTSYYVGENFDKTGMVVKAKYSDETLKEITDYTIKNGTNLVENQSSITIEYQGKTITQEIEVKAKEPEKAITSINIKAKPTKTEYIQNKEELDLTGGIIEAIYNDGSKTNVPMNSNNVTVSGFNNKVLGKNTITVEYEKKTAQFDVEIKAEEQKPIVLERIEIATPPSKTSYIVGENFDKTGMIVKAKYSDGTSKEVTNYTIKNGMNLVEGQSSVTIEYNGKTVSQTINVKAKEQKPSVEKTITAISIKTKPAKTEYIQNKEQLDLTGGSIEVTYSDGSKTEISMNSSDVIVSGFNNKVLGKNTITVTYKEKTAQFDIEIKEEKKDDDNKGNVDVKKPQNSNFDNMQVKVTKMKSYDFTDTSKKEYSIISVDISNITFANENDKMEYYYYLSSNPNEINMGKWIKIENIDKKDNKISFEINTSDISNYEEVSKANDVYLYIKEIAILNNAEQEKITKSSKLEVNDTNIEKYIDGKKKEDINSDTIVNSTPGNQTPNNSSNTEKIDKTIATEVLPKAGKGMLMIGLILILAIVGRITYRKYKDIQVK